MLPSNVERGLAGGLIMLSMVVVVEGTSTRHESQDAGRSMVVPNFCFLIVSYVE